MKIILQTISEFGNRFGPVISLYRICRKHNIEFLVVWDKQTWRVGDKNVTFKVTFNDLFKNKYIKLINKNTFNQLITDIKTYIFPKRTSGRPICQNNVCSGYNILDLELFNTYDNIVVTTTPHLIGLPTDPMHKWIPYAKKMGVYTEDDYIKELKYYFKEFEINENISNIVKNISSKFSKNMMGVQIRGDDSGGLLKKKSGTYNLLLHKIDEFLKKNESNNIFLTTLHKNLQKELIDKFPNKIITNDVLDNDSFYKHRDTKNGLIIAIANLLLLSKCDYIIGSAGSSYSFMSFIFGDCNVYETLLGYPNYK